MNLFETFIYSNKPGVRFLRHFLFWSVDVINYLVIVSINREIDSSEIVSIVLRMPPIILVTYFILYYLIPLYSKKSDRGQQLLWLLAVLIYIGVGERYYRLFMIGPFIDPGFEIPLDVWDVRRMLAEVFQWMAVISLAIAIKVIKNKTELQRTNDQLIEEKKAAELNFLKSQMHPHFLFNTLNTLYSDAIQGAGKSEQIVLRLSSLMRFILEECSKPFVPIEKEIKVIDDYLALEKLRHGDRLQIDMKQDIEDNSKLISPLLILPFIENSCKHTLSSLRGIIVIVITIRSKGGFIELYVANELATFLPHATSHGTGISNVKKQLSLLYDSRYVLDIQKGNGKYIVNLKVPLYDK